MREDFVIISGKNDGYPTFSEASDLNSFMPYGTFTTDGQKYPFYENSVFLEFNNFPFVACKKYPEMKNIHFSLILGAFANAVNLNKVSIPQSATLIGGTAFRNTSLKTVKIPKNCTFRAESFPDNCNIEFFEENLT